MKIGFFAGSFDPFTNGHLYIIKQASLLFDKLIIGIGKNEKKCRHFDISAMIKAIDITLQQNGIYNCECVAYEGLTADIATSYGATFLVRGLRNAIDYNYEENLAQINAEISGIDTLFIRAGEMGVISSTMVRELIKYGKDISGYVPKAVKELIYDMDIN